MKKQKNFQIATIAVLAVAVLFMAIGFAAYAQTLNITGTLTVKKAVWDVHWNHSGTPTAYSLTSGSQAITQTTFTDTDFQFTCTLNAPGEFCGFTINAENAGTYNADLKTITVSVEDANHNTTLPYLTAYVQYNNDSTHYGPGTHTITGVTLPKATVNGNTSTPSSHPVLARIEYVEPTNSTDLPSTDQTVTFTASFHYEQATNNS